MQRDAKSSCLKRLGRIEGQVRGLAKMVDEDRYCIDVVTQISAVRAALRRGEEERTRGHRSPFVVPAHTHGHQSPQRAVKHTADNPAPAQHGNRPRTCTTKPDL